MTVELGECSAAAPVVMAGLAAYWVVDLRQVAMELGECSAAAPVVMDGWLAAYWVVDQRQVELIGELRTVLLELLHQ